VFLCLVSLLLVGVCSGAWAGVVVRAMIEPGVFAVLKNARVLSLECRVPPDPSAAEAIWKGYLDAPERWKQYEGRQAVGVSFAQLSAQAQRKVLLAVFKEDAVTEEGWWHVVQFEGEEGLETLWTLCEWLTGKGTDHKAVLAHPKNAFSDPTLARGQRVFVPRELLLPALRAVTPDREPPAPEPMQPAPPLRPSRSDEEIVILPSDMPPLETYSNGEVVPEPAIDLEAVSRDLEYGSDSEGDYAMYRLKEGEALYSAVVVRFTDFSENAEILEACRVVQQRSGIKNVHQMKPGQKVLIPLEILSDRYYPQSSDRRQQYEAALREADRLKGEQVATRDLEGVVVVIDPGHGGRDHGAAPNSGSGLYEDELNYDIACRVKRLLESQTRARVHMLVKDLSQGYTPADSKRFAHDTDEVVLTSPPYENTDARVSANLRWYLANSIFRREVAAGVDPRKVVFTSLHTDALFNEKLRGAMVYIPGAAYRRDSEEHSGSSYDRYKEVREQPCARTTASERTRDEALSRNFAEALLKALGTHNPPIKRHSAGDPIRSQIRQSGGRVYVPAVLRNAQIPTKVLVEAANMTNSTDCERLADPEWREWFAEAYVDALRDYFGS